jgi:hypothetical protein
MPPCLSAKMGNSHHWQFAMITMPLLKLKSKLHLQLQVKFIIKLQVVLKLVLCIQIWSPAFSTVLLVTRLIDHDLATSIRAHSWPSRRPSIEMCWLVLLYLATCITANRQI